MDVNKILGIIDNHDGDAVDLAKSLGGALEKRRAKTAVKRAGGHELPQSKFMPNVPRAVHAEGGWVEHYEFGGTVDAPQKTVKAYKLFRKKGDNIYPLFVDANTPVPMGQWIAAKAGDPGKDPKKVKSKLGDLAYRPGWHAGDLPIATHIGGKSHPKLTKPDYRPDEQVWAEVEMPNDVDWQSVANERAQKDKSGKIKPVTAHITDQVPEGGHYRYKTNPNMTGNWLIGGSMKVNRILGDDEVQSINDEAGVADLPRLRKMQEGGPVYPTAHLVEHVVKADGGATKKGKNVIFLNDKTAIVGQEHGKPLDLHPDDLKKVQDIASQHGVFYEGNGADRAHTKGQIKDYQGSWDEQFAKNIKGYPHQFIYALFSNVDANNRINKIGANPNKTIFDHILDKQEGNSYFPGRRFGPQELNQFLSRISDEDNDFYSMSQHPATKENVAAFLKHGESQMWPDNWEEYPNNAGKVAKEANDMRDQYLASRDSGVYTVGSGHLVEVQNMLQNDVPEKAEGGEIASPPAADHEHMHPAMMIPGVHIRGHNPIFSGRK